MRFRHNEQGRLVGGQGNDGLDWTFVWEDDRLVRYGTSTVFTMSRTGWWAGMLDASCTTTVGASSQ